VFAVPFNPIVDEEPPPPFVAVPPVPNTFE
jgi:hypothetical protein